MMKFTVFVILSLIAYTQALGLGGCTTRTNECKDIPKLRQGRALCAVMYEEPCCNSGDVHVIDGEERTFSTNVFRDDVDASDLIDNKDKEDDIESIVVNANCTLTIYKDTDCEGESYILQAAARKDLIIKDLEEESRDEDGDLEEFDNEIGCVKCMCGTGGQEPVIRQKEQGTLGKLGSKLSGLFGR
eukprot:02949.XXX_4743_4068_1 [CDS] Oithona nana genome sequencing.